MSRWSFLRSFNTQKSRHSLGCDGFFLFFQRDFFWGEVNHGHIGVHVLLRKYPQRLAAAALEDKAINRGNGVRCGLQLLVPHIALNTRAASFGIVRVADGHQIAGRAIKNVIFNHHIVVRQRKVVQ